MYEKKPASIQFLILHLIIWCALWSLKYSMCSQFIPQCVIDEICNFYGKPDVSQLVL